MAIKDNKTIPAVVDFTKRFVNKPINLGKWLIGMGGGSSGALARGAQGVGKKTDGIIAGTLNNKYASGALMIVAAVAIYKGVKGIFSRKEKAQVNEDKQQELQAIQAENAAMKAELYGGYNNPRAKGGHVANYQSQQAKGAVQGMRQQ